ncbi:hypothetical protein ACHWQZ_G002531 [Mnemiopsis leidyi]
MEAGFCQGYLSDGRCVTKNEKSEVKTGCAKVTPDADLCCAVKMRNSDITERFKAFRVRDQQQISFKVILYPSYSNLGVQPHIIDNLKDTQQLTVDNILFEEVTVTKEDGNNDGILNSATWYIGKSNPYYNTVYEYSKEVNLKDGYDISKVGWVKFHEGKYQLGSDRIPDVDILGAFSATVRDCGDSDITSAFDSTDLADFKSSLQELRAIQSTYVDRVTWKNSGEENHGIVDWTYKKSAYKIDLKFKLTGNHEDFVLKKVSITSKIGDFQALVVNSEHGEAYIHINMTESYGHMFGRYTINGEDPLDFSFEVFNETFYEEYYKNDHLECKKNAAGQLCLNVEDGQPQCKTVRCTERMIVGPGVDNNTINTETVVSDDPLNWRTWAKYANPMEWFNGISSYQEVIMLVVELVGMLGGVFLVLKILRMLNLLGKCCRCMFCCFLCPKTEKKVRDRANTFKASYRRRLTETKRRLTMTSERVKSSFRRNNRVSSGSSSKRSFRNRLTTAAAVQYLRSKVKRGQQELITNEYELEGGVTTPTSGVINGDISGITLAKKDPPHKLDGAESGHVNVMCEIEEVEEERNSPAVKTVSFQ